MQSELPVVSQETIHAISSELENRDTDVTFDEWMKDLKEKNPDLMSMMVIMAEGIDSSEFLTGFLVCYGCLTRQSRIDNLKDNMGEV